MRPLLTAVTCAATCALLALSADLARSQSGSSGGAGSSAGGGAGSAAGSATSPQSAPGGLSRSGQPSGAEQPDTARQQPGGVPQRDTTAPQQDTAPQQPGTVRPLDAPGEPDEAGRREQPVLGGGQARGRARGQAGGGTGGLGSRSKQGSDLQGSACIAAWDPSTHMTRERWAEVCSSLDRDRRLQPKF